MNVNLVVIGGKNAGRKIPVSGEKFFIGRAEDCHLRPGSDLVSRHHCAIMLDDNEVTVRDFGSRNGTLVNGEKIRGEEELRSGDRLKIGPLEFEVLIEVQIEGKKKPKVETVEQAAARTVESAAAKPDEGELDIADWIADTVDGGGSTKAMGTFSPNTVSMNTPEAETTTTTPPPEPPVEEAEKKEEKPKRTSPSGIHGLKGPKTMDSQSAAADALRAFFKRK